MLRVEWKQSNCQIFLHSKNSEHFPVGSNEVFSFTEERSHFDSEHFLIFFFYKIRKHQNKSNLETKHRNVSL